MDRKKVSVEILIESDVDIFSKGNKERKKEKLLRCCVSVSPACMRVSISLERATVIFQT